MPLIFTSSSVNHGYRGETRPRDLQVLPKTHNYRHVIAKLPTRPEIPRIKRDETGIQRAQPPLTLAPTHATSSIDRSSPSDLG